MGNFWLDLGVLLVLLVANGFFSASELGVVSSRKTRLEGAADRGDSRARRALDLANRPTAFLATVQIGLSLLSTVTAFFAGAQLTGPVEGWLRPLLGGYAGAVSSILVVLSVTFLTLVIGELAPKSIALRSPEALAVRVAPFFTGLSKVARPAVWLLDATTRGLLALLGLRGERQDRVTEEDVRALVEQATEGGSLELSEQGRIERVLRFTDRRVRDLMTSRVDAVSLNLDRPLTENVACALKTGHDRYPVRRGTQEVVGTLGVTDLLRALAGGERLDDLLRPAIFVPEGADADDALAQLQRHPGARMAVVVDEYGDFTGLITASDLIRELVGGRHDPELDSELLRREDGSYTAEGGLAMHSLRERLPLPQLPEEEFSTLAGYVLALFGRLPTVGEASEVGGWRLEVLDRDGPRIDRVLIVPPKGLG